LHCLSPVYLVILYIVAVHGITSLRLSCTTRTDGRYYLPISEMDHVNGLLRTRRRAHPAGFARRRDIFSPISFACDLYKVYGAKGARSLT